MLIPKGGEDVDNFSKAVEIALNKEVEQYEKELKIWEKENEEYLESKKADSERLLNMLLELL